MDRIKILLFLSFLAASLAGSFAAEAGAAADTPVSEQRAALAKLAAFDGIWRGPAKVTLPSGKVVEITQAERVGPMLDGDLRVIEGRGYAPDGSLRFNAFGVISYDPASKAYHFRSYAEGREGDFPFEVRPDGFVWSIPAGPATIRYTATVKDGVWTEIGERMVDGQPAARIFEMSLQRVGSTGWPQDGAVLPK